MGTVGIFHKEPLDWSNLVPLCCLAMIQEREPFFYVNVCEVLNPALGQGPLHIF